MKFDMSRAWSEAVAMISANREVLLIIAGIFFFLPAVLQGFVMPPMSELLSGSDPQVMQRRMLDAYGSYGWLISLVVLAQVVGTLAMLALLRHERRPTVGEAIGSGVAGLLPVIGAYLLLGLAFTLLVVLIVAAGLASTALGIVLALLIGIAFIYISVRLTLLLPVIAIDQVRNPLTAIKRSWAATGGNVLRILLFFVLLSIAYIVLALVIGFLVGGIGLLLGQGGALVLEGLAAGVIGAVATMVFTAVSAAIHRQLTGPAPQPAPYE
ncbi:glycerophosphoryl diester phosphodiesterase membrane domain-containing protein [Croceibacterium sp. TMG7-5b_MA50]|uniref:glycerophosphoryl diester phosphodiesterase membrane domain-containing protein n=1 Tax=Croceibacterium sp. TMG7-5b_MA50 TaxID=3121290 RepID=UPI003221CCE2